MKTNELIGPALNWAVVKAIGQNADYWLEKYASEDRRCMCESPSTDWSQGGPIIERELIRVIAPTVRGVDWVARIKQPLLSNMNGWFEKSGPTPLVAAMRTYIASKLGDEVEIPEELK